MKFSLIKCKLYHMNNLSIKKSRHNKRRDGQVTRDVILQAAGSIFAQYGYSDATSKEICELAGTNSAAVNYHFGGKENLYEEVLVEAHRQFLSMEDLNEIFEADISAQQKLRAFLRQMLHTAHASPQLWGIKVFLRELASPSPIVNQAMASAVLPKAEILRKIVAQISNLPFEAPQVQRATAFVVLPCISLIMFPEKLRLNILPATAANAASMLDDMACYVLGGLKALGERQSC